MKFGSLENHIPAPSTVPFKVLLPTPSCGVPDKYLQNIWLSGMNWQVIMMWHRRQARMNERHEMFCRLYRSETFSKSSKQKKGILQVFYAACLWWTQSRRSVYQVMECGNRRLLLGQCLPLFRCWGLLLLGSTFDNAMQCLPQGRMFVPVAHHSAVCCTAIHCLNYCYIFRKRAVNWFKNPKKIKIYSLSTWFWSCFTKYRTTKSKRWKQVY